MKLEHIAFDVADPQGLAKWWCENLGMRVVRASGPPVFGHFLADSAGQSIIEIYNNPTVTPPDYASMKSATLHLAFVSDDPEAMRDKLIAAGATAMGETLITPSGDIITEVRDPFGFVIQFAKRGKNLI
jgi:glyoxylase I family protein